MGLFSNEQPFNESGHDKSDVETNRADYEKRACEEDGQFIGCFCSDDINYSCNGNT
jgi:hypothetical protein